MKAPLKKIFIARYVLMLEVLGFLIMGAIISGMVFCVFHKIDDECKVKTDVVTGHIEPVEVAGRSFIQSVEAKDGAVVAKGQTVLSALSNPADVSVMEAKLNLAASQQLLTSASQAVAVTPQAIDSIKMALAGSEQIAPAGQVQTVSAPIDGIIKGADLATMAGTIKAGKLAEVHNYNTLRFSVPVGGKNADRVNINLLGAQDILDWKHVTAAIKAKEAPESGAARHVWGLLNEDEANKEKLKFIAPGKAPDTIGKGDVVAALNGLLRKKDFYKPNVWDEASLDQEARNLIAKDPATLKDPELYRLNRILMEAAFPEFIKKSENQLQPVKAKIIVPKKSLLVEGKEKKQKPDIYELRGKVLTDKDAAGAVLVELDNPPAELTDYLKKRLADSTLLGPSMTGGIVVGQIPMFRFLFSKE